MLKSVNRVLLVTTSAFCLMSTTIAQAGNFTVDWNTLAYTNNAANQTFTISDQYGFQIDVAFTHVGQDTSANILGEDAATGGQVGGINDILFPANAGAGAGGFNEGSATGTMTFLLPGTATRVGVNGLQTVVTDIDPSDTNAAGDRCDMITVTAENTTGGGLAPTLGYANGAPTGTGANTTYLIGPSTGPSTSGSAANYRTIFTRTGGQTASTNLNLAANQAHCLYYPDAAYASPSSVNNNFGTVTVAVPNGASRMIVKYDEVIENALNVTNRDAATRGIGLWGATSFTTANSLTLDKQTTTANFGNAGDTVAYQYVVTNNGPLPFRATQNIQINDDKIGIINCPALPAAGVAVGATFTCTANYTVTAADATAGFVTNTATAGIGTGTQAFAARLQSNADAVTVRRRAIVGVQKTTTGGFGGPHQFTATNLTAPIANISTTAAGVATPATPTLVPVTTSGTAVQINETANPNWVIGSVTCNDSNTAVSGNTNPVATGTALSITIPPARIVNGARITCRFTNAQANPQLTIDKQASTPGPVVEGQVITYTFFVTNTGNVPINTVQAIENAFNGTGPAPVPGSETLTTDAVPTGNSTDATANNGVWSVLAPGDVVRFSANYTVEQADIDTLQ
jgi:hypothetical protein